MARAKGEPQSPRCRDARKCNLAKTQASEALVAEADAEMDVFAADAADSERDDAEESE